MSKLIFYVLSFLFLSLLTLTSCATTDSRVSLLYVSTGTARGGFGEIILYAPTAGKESNVLRSLDWELGKIRDKDGKTVARVISARSPEALVIEAFTQEFRSSGYNPVITGNNLSNTAEKGLRILDVSINLNNTKKFLSDEATCIATVTVQPIKSGKEIKKLRYESSMTFSRVSDRDQIAADILHKTLQNLMKKAMPDIVKLIETS